LHRTHRHATDRSGGAHPAEIIGMNPRPEFLARPGLEARAMAKPTTDELKQNAQEVFGRALNDAQVEAYRGRLPTMVRNVQRLRDWEPRLRHAEPALVQRVLGARGDE
jgi:hypothetical protein